MNRSLRFSVNIGIKINVALCLLALAELIKFIRL